MEAAGEDGVIRACGGVIARDGRVVVVHRPKYDDWSLPKGKAHGDEGDEECALREIEEETGLRVSLGEELATTTHLDAQGRPKRIRWWRMTPLSGDFTPSDEIDELRWLTPDEARELLTYPRDIELVDSLKVIRYELEFEDTFSGDVLDRGRWLPYYLPQWSTRERASARYELGGGGLRLLIEADQAPWCPELDGRVRVSSFQTGVFAGAVGSAIGQHRFDPRAIVTEAQRNVRLYTPQYGRIELRAKALDDPQIMVALWLIGYEDEPARSAEICVCEIFGRDVEAEHASVGMGIHPFGDPTLVDDFSAVRLPIDVREFHVYAAEWTIDQVAFFVDGDLVKTVRQSPSYPMQLMLGIYEFPPDGDVDAAPGDYPKAFVVDYVRGYRVTD